MLTGGNLDPKRLGHSLPGQVRPETPNRREERLMRIVNDIQIGEICKGFRSTLGGCQVPDCYVTAHDLCYLDG